MSELPIIAGQTEGWQFTFTQGDGQPENLTGATVTLESDGDAIASTMIVTNAALGQVLLTMTPEQSGAVTRRERVRCKVVSGGGEVTLHPWFWLAPQ